MQQLKLFLAAVAIAFAVNASAQENKLFNHLSIGYTLGTDGTKLGFYHWDGTTLGANRAYVAGSGNVKGFAINWGDADGINSVNNGQAMENATIYNLAGQRMNKVQRGVNIVNGKKVIIK